MGVVYKFSEDVVNFVVEKKRSSPSISCRELANIVNQQFQTNVSKSSINNILKNAQLSSSVGRRPGFSLKNRKFEIPKEKKEQISKNLSKLGFKKEIKPSSLTPALIPRAPEPVLPQVVVPAEKKEKTTEPSLVLRPDPLEIIENAESVGVRVGSEPEGTSNIEKTLNDIYALRERRNTLQPPKYDHMGLIFLKALQWESSRESLIGKIVRRYVDQELHAGFDVICETLLLLNALEKKSESQARGLQNSGAWVLNGFADEPDFKTLFSWGDSIMIPSAGLLQYAQEKEQNFSSVQGFKIILDDKTFVILDSLLTAVRHQGVAGAGSFFYNAMKLVSAQIISNYESLVLRSAFLSDEVAEEFYQLLMSFENLPGKSIKKVVVFDKEGREITAFSLIPSKRRSVIFGILPQQKEFPEVVKVSRYAQRKPYYFELTDKICYFTDTKTEYFQKYCSEAREGIRVVTLWEEDGQEPAQAIVTNNFHLKAEDIIYKYLMRWDNLGEKDGLTKVTAVDGQDSQLTTDTSLWGVLDDLNRELKIRFYERFVVGSVKSTLLSDLYAIPGHLYRSKDCFRVLLDVSGSPVDKDQFLSVVNNINRAFIHDDSGRRLFLEVKH